MRDLKERRERKFKKIANTITLFFIVIILSVWTFWGIVENFHEGWYSKSLKENILIMFIQYLSIPIVLLILALLSLGRHKTGGILWILLWGFSLYFLLFGGNIEFSIKRAFLWFFLTLPLLFIGLSFYFFDYENKKRSAFIFVSVPVIIVLIFGIPLFIKVNKRINDHNFGKRVIEGNGVKLLWAPRGVGFPERGTDWYKAKKICSHLGEDGYRLFESQKNIWRLPKKDEIVRSLTRGNRNCKGFINRNGKPVYAFSPDKETPLWDPNSIVIYYWSSDSKNSSLAYLVSYNGRILLRAKSNGADYHGFRCVRDIE